MKASSCFSYRRDAEQHGRSRLIGCALVGLCLLLVTGCSRPAIHVEAIALQTPDGMARGLVATVDLEHVDVVVSSGGDDNLDDDRLPMQSTFEFARQTDSDLAFNANFYGNIEGDRADPVGLVMNDGAFFSEPRIYDDVGDPAILFVDGAAFVVPRFDDFEPTTREAEPATNPLGISAADFEEIFELLVNEKVLAALVKADAVAGVGPSATAPDLDTVLLLDGENLGVTSRVDPLVRHPRTAVGVSADNRTLIIIVIDGRQPDHSVGITLPELAELMQQHGADDALNLDGGGSSSFVYRNADGTLLTNRPSDGDFRKVAVSVGIRVKD